MSTSSPYTARSTGAEANSSSTLQSQGFNIESFDFGADFSLPSSLDDLAIFNNAHQAASNSHDGTTAGTSSQVSQSGSLASPGGNSTTAHGHGEQSSNNHASSRSSKAGHVSSSNSIAGSPRSMHFSPRSTMREKILQASSSRHQSPHAIGITQKDGNGATVISSSPASDTTSVTGTSINAKEIQDLLNAIDASSLSQQQHQQQIQGGNLSMEELEKLLAEKEKMERAQSIQTAYLRQQLDALQRQGRGPQQHHMLSLSGTSESSSAAPISSVSAVSASQLMQQFQQMHSQQNGTGLSYPLPFMASTSGTGVSPHAAVAFSANANKAGMNPSSSVNPYGLITPASSGAFSSHLHRGQAPFVSPLDMPCSSQGPIIDMGRVQDPSAVANGSFTPLESPAITPASVFSTVGSTATSTDLFSPLTSPALRPQSHVGHEALAMQLSPYHGPIQVRGRPRPGTRGIPGSSPVALTGVTKSVPRKNRSTTAEARANRARASPLVKPTVPAKATQPSRKRNESGSTGMPSPLGPNLPVGSRRTSQDGTTGGDKQTPQAFPPLSAGSGTARPMDASPSETAASTPSPIEMPPPNGKPMTPSSIMGMQQQRLQTQQQPANSATAENGKTQENGAHSASLRNSKVLKSSSSGPEVLNGKLADVPPLSPGGLPNILPGGLSGQDREAWVSAMRSSGGGGGLETRRTSHKAAEQKRRDSLKYCFDELRGMLPAITLDDEVPGGSMLGPDGLLEDQDTEGFSIEEVGDSESARIANRAISKVALLRHSNEYLIRLKHRMGRRERDLALCRREIMDLRSRLGLPISPEMPALTASMAGSAAMSGHDMSGFLKMASGAADAHQHQMALFAALQQQQQQQEQQQQQQHMQQARSMTNYSHSMHGASDATSMDISS